MKLSKLSKLLTSVLFLTAAEILLREKSTELAFFLLFLTLRLLILIGVRGTATFTLLTGADGFGCSMNLESSNSSFIFDGSEAAVSVTSPRLLSPYLSSST